MKKNVFLMSLLLFLSMGANAAWEHSKTQDRMGRGTGEIALIKSDNELNLKLPYDGKQRGEFALRRSGRGANEFLLTIKKGQIICGVGRCALTVRVDDGTPFVISGAHPKDGSSNIVIGDLSVSDFRKIKKAKKILIEITIYENGENILEFSAENNPFIGNKGYLLGEIKSMIKNGKGPDVIKASDYPMDTPSFDICRQVTLKKDNDDDLVRVIETNKKSEVIVAEYSEYSLLRMSCKKGKNDLLMEFYDYK